MTASGSHIAEIAGRHMRYHDRTMLERCTDCGQPWPCDASVLAGMLTRERLAAALFEANASEWTDQGEQTVVFAGSVTRLATAILAALEAQP